MATPKGGNLPGTKGHQGEPVPPGYYRPKTSNREFFGNKGRKMLEKGVEMGRTKKVRKSK